MSATESVSVPVPAVEQTIASPEVRAENLEVSAPADEVPAPVVESAPAGEPAPVEPAPAAEPPKEEEKAETNKEHRISGFFSKLIPPPFNKSKRSFKKEKKDSKDQPSSSSEEATSPKMTEPEAKEAKDTEAPPPAETEAAVEPATDGTDASAVPPALATTEGESAPNPDEKEERKDTVPEPSKLADEAKAKATKVGRRLSARVGSFFKAKPKEEVLSQKVDEAPPKIEQPEPVEPLENPSQSGAPASEESKPAEPAAPATPVVAAAA